MTIVTVWNVDERPFIISNGEICKAKVTNIIVTIQRYSDGTLQPVIRYNLDYTYNNDSCSANCSNYRQEQMFKTKEDAAKAWLKQNNVKCGIGET